MNEQQKISLTLLCSVSTKASAKYFMILALVECTFGMFTLLHAFCGC